MNTPRSYSIVTPANLRAFTGHPGYEANQKKARHNGHYVDQTSCCAYCGKKAIESDLSVLLSNVGEYITKEEADAFEIECAARGGSPDDLGYYPVGSDCARKLRAAGIPVYATPAF